MDSSTLRDLRTAYDSGQLIAFVGAGVSVGAGLPTWRKLAEILRDRAQERGAEPSALLELDELIQGNQLLDAISAAKHLLRVDFEREVLRSLDDRGIPDVPEAAAAIAALSPRLWSVITTNLDRLLSRAFSGAWDELTDPPGNLAQDKHYILKIHGTLRDARTWVFTRDQYDKAMFASPQLQATIGALYRTHPFLFLGFGLADDNIDLTLGQIRAQSGGQPPTHYALLPKGITGPSRRRKLEDSGVRLIEYPNERGTHAELTQILRWLAGPAAAAVPGAALSSPAMATSAQVPGGGPQPGDLADLSPRVQTSSPGAAASSATTGSTGPLATFICYAPGDADLLKRLEIHLSQVKREKLIAAWHVGQVQVGEEEEAVARERLASAKLILLLISAEFLATEKNDEQIALAMDRHDQRSAHVVPILLRPCDWETSRFAKLQALPRDKTPVAKASDSDEAFTKIVKELRGLIGKLAFAAR
ncbi:SIR2 family protein [Chondromyces crocatus]|uniref:TIR domain-containing protein n=1 Tax=Chondromyces crocatus TaxID=52 RepID=A0A0K1E577_CHOCO|nr:SIR2 family protein [Chondromyces crocatus]AKT36030.1 uncharacterized protein CMC5_001420 [Chondromyces crocatus]